MTFIQEFYENTFNHEFFLNISNETNKYNEQVNKYKVSKNTLKKTDVTTIEMERFFELIILMGQAKKSTL